MRALDEWRRAEAVFLYVSVRGEPDTRALIREAVEAGRPARAEALLGELIRFWADRTPTLEKLVSHDALHDVAAALAEARICLACGDHDDFLRTMSTARLGLEHLYDEEALSWENLY